MHAQARCLALGLAIVVNVSVASAQDIAPMPDTRGLDPSSATGCARGITDACVNAGDTAMHAGDGARASVLYRRAADLARRALHVPARPMPPGRIRTVAAAIMSLEAAWHLTVVRGAGRHGQRTMALSAQAEVFGDAAVAHWSGRRANIADAFGAVHRWTNCENGAFATGVWVGDLRLLAADGPCWQLTFAYQNLDFAAFVDDDGHVIALVHIPEG